MIRFTRLVLSLAIFNFVTLSSLATSVLSKNSDEICDPHTMTTNQYPAILIKLDVVLTNPLKLRAHFRLPNSTKEISAEGVVFAGMSFGNDQALVACRSMGCSKLSARTPISSTATQTCRFTCPDGTSALQMCRTIQRNMKCPTDAMSLRECVTEAFFSSVYPGPNSVAIVCTECGED